MTVSPSDVTSYFGPIDAVGSGGTAIAWSPDGHKVVFTVFADEGGDGFTQLYQSDDHCATPRRLTSPESPTQSAESAPAWSPDGRLVAFWSYGAGIAVVDPTAGANPRTVVAPDISSFNFWTALSWSPDGQFIAYANATPREILIAATAGGGSPRRIGTDGVAGWAPAWAPR
jgi:Tol biopolymer transport system component